MSNRIENMSLDAVAFGDVVQKWTTDIVYVIDKSGVVRGGNERLWTDLGILQPQTELIALLNLIAEDERTIAWRTWEIVLKHRKSERSIRKFRTATGEQKVYSIVEAPVLSENEAMSIVGVGRDITEESNLEDKLWSAQVNREAALEYAVRASMGLVKGYVYSLQKIVSLPEYKRERFSRIVAEEVDTMGKNIDNLLLSRGVGIISDESIIFDVSVVVAEVIDQQKHESERRQITLHFNRPDQEVNFFGQPFAIARIVANLVDFAILRLTHSGEIAIAIQDCEEYVEIAITDNGTEVDNEMLEWMMSSARVTELNTSSVAGSKFDVDVARLLSESLGGGVIPSALASGGLAFTVMLPRSPLGSSRDAASMASLAI